MTAQPHHTTIGVQDEARLPDIAYAWDHVHGRIHERAIDAGVSLPPIQKVTPRLLKAWEVPEEFWPPTFRESHSLAP